MAHLAASRRPAASPSIGVTTPRSAVREQSAEVRGRHGPPMAPGRGPRHAPRPHGRDVPHPLGDTLRRADRWTRGGLRPWRSAPSSASRSPTCCCVADPEPILEPARRQALERAGTGRCAGRISGSTHGERCPDDSREGAGSMTGRSSAVHVIGDGTDVCRPGDSVAPLPKVRGVHTVDAC